MKKIISKKNLVIGLSLAVIALTAAGSVFAKAYDIGLREVTVEETLAKAIKWAVGISSMICALIIVIAGVLWITASGDDEQLKKARKMLIAGVVGLVIVLGAWALVTVARNLFQ